jgi:hypothetical protein
VTSTPPGASPIPPDVADAVTPKGGFIIWCRARLGLDGLKIVPTGVEIVRQNEHLKLRLRRWIAIVAGTAALGQVVCADLVFIRYASHGMHWRVPAGAIEAWLAATVVQVIGIVLVITRSLFPASQSHMGGDGS